MRFWYTAWLRDNRLPDDDQDYEWPLSFIIEGKTFTSAREWGDLVARRYALDVREEFLSSTIVRADKQLSPDMIAAERVFVEGSDVTTDELTYASTIDPNDEAASKTDRDGSPVDAEPPAPQP